MTFGPINTCKSHSSTFIFSFWWLFFAFELWSQISERTFGCFWWNAEFACNSNSYNLQIVIWDVTLWNLVDECRKVSEERAHSTFRGATFSLISTLKKETASLSEELHSFTKPYAVTAQKTTIWTLTAGKLRSISSILILRILHVP
jgi:hypothetical protein